MPPINKVIRFGKLILQSFSNTDYLVGCRDNGDGTFTDYRYTINTSGVVKQKITSTVNGKIISDNFFLNNIISEIVTSNQVYLEGDDFTQLADTITFINLDLFIGQKLLAKV